ncbi:MAG: geranylgeranyl reductase family protein [Desulfarculaceae bacterium]|nr:geranylgeranyl reductase family protein [Desulfarculaceae bacterium]
MPERVDVLVVGGGPAGALAAREAAVAGAKVLLTDQKARFGALPHCAEFVPRLLAAEVEFPPHGKSQPVAGMVSVIGGDERFMPGPGWILDRQVWDHGLVMQAVGAGALAWAGTRLTGREGEIWGLKRGGRVVEVIAGAVVAADGAASATARLSGWERQALMAGVQMQVPLARAMERTRVYLDPAFKHGYAWLFPKGAAGNLGLGCRTEAKPLRRLEELRQKLEADGMIKPGVLAMAGGAIPVGGVRQKLSRGRVILAGDAAGLPHPITGAGIPQAVFSGILAGRAAARRAGGDGAAGENYQHELLGRYGRNLLAGLVARQKMEAGWESEDFAGLMAKVWPGWRGEK